ncbi:MAG: hypothetical protein K8W52_43665 [Deltaproteobacteria bacterium]|nr:hypothetical protein [Deltaproteobacteria bacterium]
MDHWKFSQTAQYSDPLDKQFGIYNDVFTDGVDIHKRASARNQYGPVLFQLPLGTLQTLPPGTNVMVTKKNPVKWSAGEPDSARYFLSLEELSTGYQFGEFDQHVVLRTPGAILNFSSFPVTIVLDNPVRALSNGHDAFQSAVNKLQAAAAAGGMPIVITQRQCRSTCRCCAGHKNSYEFQNLDAIF